MKNQPGTMKSRPGTMKKHKKTQAKACGAGITEKRDPRGVTTDLLDV